LAVAYGRRRRHASVNGGGHRPSGTWTAPDRTTWTTR